MRLVTTSSSAGPRWLSQSWSGKARFAPSACGMALAMVPWVRLIGVRRFPLALT